MPNFIATTRRRDAEKRRGAIIVMAAVFLIMLIAFLAFAIDLGHINVVESELQNAADAGALSGARALSVGREDAILKAKYWAGRNSSANSPVSILDEDVEVGVWDQETAVFTALAPDSKTTPNAVRVTTQRTKDRGNTLQLFFAPVIGTKNIDQRVSAVATGKSSSCGDIIALNRIYLNNRNRISYTDGYDSSEGPYSAGTSTQTGDVCTNGHITLNGGAAINGKAARWIKSKSPNLNGPITGGVTTFPDYLEFPDVKLGDVATNNSNGSIDKSDSGKKVLTGGRFSLGNTKNPGASGDDGYMSLASGNADSITLAPGSYYFSEMAIGSGSTVIVTGPTYIYVTGQIDLSYGQINNVGKRPIDLQIYPCSTVDSQYAIHLPTYGELHAVIYAPHADIFANLGVPYTLEFYGKMVGQLIRIWSTSLHVDNSVKFGSLKSGGEQTSPSGSTGDDVILVQ
jgi:Flp pilus assembly protein TadG